MLTKHSLQSTIRGELGRPLERAVRTELRRRDARARPVSPSRLGPLIAAETLARPLRELPANSRALWARLEHRAISSWGAETQWHRPAP